MNDRIAPGFQFSSFWPKPFGYGSKSKLARSYSQHRRISVRRKLYFWDRSSYHALWGLRCQGGNPKSCDEEGASIPLFKVHGNFGSSMIPSEMCLFRSLDWRLPSQKLEYQQKKNLWKRGKPRHHTGPSCHTPLLIPRAPASPFSHSTGWSAIMWCQSGQSFRPLSRKIPESLNLGDHRGERSPHVSPLDRVSAKKKPSQGEPENGEAVSGRTCASFFLDQPVEKTFSWFYEVLCGCHQSSSPPQQHLNFTFRNLGQTLFI